MLVCGDVPAFLARVQRTRRKTSMVFDVKLVDEHVYVVVDDEVRTTRDAGGICSGEGPEFCLRHGLNLAFRSSDNLFAMRLINGRNYLNTRHITGMGFRCP